MWEYWNGYGFELNKWLYQNVRAKKKKKVIKYLLYNVEVATLVFLPKNSDIPKLAWKSDAPVPNSAVDSLAENKLQFCFSPCNH